MVASCRGSVLPPAPPHSFTVPNAIYNAKRRSSPKFHLIKINLRIAEAFEICTCRKNGGAIRATRDHPSYEKLPVKSRELTLTSEGLGGFRAEEQASNAVMGI